MSDAPSGRQSNCPTKSICSAGLYLEVGLRYIYLCPKLHLPSFFSSSRKDIRQDSRHCHVLDSGQLVWGIICCFLTPGFMPDLPSFLFGSILTIGTGRSLAVGILTAFVCILFTLFSRPIECETIGSYAFAGTLFDKRVKLPATVNSLATMLL